MITKLIVWITLPAGEILKAGELAVKDPDFRGALQGQFRYAPEYIDNSKAFPLDPLNLPLGTELFNANRPHEGVHSVFEDSLPDDWGRKLMARRYKLGRAEQRIPHLLRLLGRHGLGALSYSDEPDPPLSAIGVLSRYLDELAFQAEKFEKDPTSVDDDELTLLFRAGSSPGGARPKALVFDNSGAYLAKFASTKDQLDAVGLEAAAMELARLSGIETAETILFTFGIRKCLLVKRFDVNVAGGRNHLISMQSLLKADGYYNAGYRDLAMVIKHVSTFPQRDLHMLYRQMVFNAMIGNTDDHLKNFCMLHDDHGWRLSPAFDLVPNIGFNREHVLRIGLNTLTPDHATLLEEAKHFGIKRRQSAVDMLQQVCTAVLQWPSIFAGNDVPEKDMEIIGKEIGQKIIKLASPLFKQFHEPGQKGFGKSPR
ncbi:MAG: type II toxin-antitoxin system HipA family toxin [Pseudomonadota bacterium]